MDHEAFLSGYRQVFGNATQPQVDGLDFLLSRMERDPELEDLREWAYILATVKWETAHTFQPIDERAPRGMDPDLFFEGRYGPQTRVGQRLGNARPGDGARYHGRGYVQLTGRHNYTAFGIADRPEAALEPERAYEILVRGMLRGRFGRRLNDFIPPRGVADYEGARRSVNGTDHAGDIAKIALRFETLLRAAAAG